MDTMKYFEITVTCISAHQDSIKSHDVVDVDKVRAMPEGGHGLTQVGRHGRSWKLEAGGQGCWKPRQSEGLLGSASGSCCVAGGPGRRKAGKCRSEQR